MKDKRNLIKKDVQKVVDLCLQWQGITESMGNPDSFTDSIIIHIIEASEKLKKDFQSQFPEVYK